MKRQSWFALAAAVVWLTSCGGSSSETPFPEEPLPDYVRHTPAPKEKKSERGQASAQNQAGQTSDAPTPEKKKGEKAPASEPAGRGAGELPAGKSAPAF